MNQQKLDEITRTVTTYEYYDLVNEMNDLFPSIPVDITAIKNHPNVFRQNIHPEYNFLYRVRGNASNLREPWGNLNSISFIPPHKIDFIKEYGRVNKPKQSMFYCSTEWHVAVYEMLPRGIKHDPDNDQEFWFTMGTWKLEDDLVLATLPKSEKYLKELMDALPELGIPDKDLEHARRFNVNLQKRLNNEEAFKCLMYFADHFAKTKTDNKKEYMLSNYFADRAFGRIKGFNELESSKGSKVVLDGIIYPSVPSGYNYSNIVMEPEVVAKKLKFMWASRVRFRWMRDGSWDLLDGNQNVQTDKIGNFSWDL